MAMTKMTQKCQRKQEIPLSNWEKKGTVILNDIEESSPKHPSRSCTPANNWILSFYFQQKVLAVEVR